MEWVLGFFNRRLIGEPLNWAIVFVIASVWLLAFHVVMQGFTAMQGDKKQASIGGAPGQVAPGNAVGFLTGSTIATAESPEAVGMNLSSWGLTGGAGWSDQTEAKYAWDGITEAY
jgi:hypothetical protein